MMDRVMTLLVIKTIASLVKKVNVPTRTVIKNTLKCLRLFLKLNLVRQCLKLSLKKQPKKDQPHLFAKVTAWGGV